jgi:peroxiredoxin
LRDRAREFEELNAAVLLVSFVGGRLAEAWLKDTVAPFPMLIDESQQVYRDYRLGRARLTDWTPRVIWNYLKWIARGYLPRKVSGDPYQLGGDFIVDSAGIVRFVHKSRDATDRPSVESLIQSLHQTASKGEDPQ